jgi:hypothetical protein
MYGKPVGIEAGIDGEYLLDAFFRVGPTEWRQDQEGPISWAELQAYGIATQRLVEPWEYEAVMAMSKAYLRAKIEGKDVHCIAPVDRETE